MTISSGNGKPKLNTFKHIIDIRKFCEKITCVPYPKESDQPLKIQELVIMQ